MRCRWPWRRNLGPTRTGGMEAAREARERLREVKRRGPEIRDTVHQLRAALQPGAESDPFIEQVRREFRGHA